MKFKAHETFFIRKGWLSKGMKYISQKPNLFTDKTQSPLEILGLGANMVKSLRYWLCACGLCFETLEEKKRVQRLTNFGRLVFENDRFIEEIGTLCFLQYKIASNKDAATSYQFFFNGFALSEFSKEDFLLELKKNLLNCGVAVPPESTLESDFDCIIKTYLPRKKLRLQESDGENNIDCPLGELSLIDIVDKKKGVYKKSSPPASVFNAWVTLAVIAQNAAKKKEVRLSDLLTGQNSLAKIFNLNAAQLLEILYEAEKKGLLKIVRTSGLDVVELHGDFDFEKCVEMYYKEIEK